jgi:hypothetical protein
MNLSLCKIVYSTTPVYPGRSSLEQRDVGTFSTWENTGGRACIASTDS